MLPGMQPHGMQPHVQSAQYTKTGEYMYATESYMAYIRLDGMHVAADSTLSLPSYPSPP